MMLRCWRIQPLANFERTLLVSNNRQTHRQISNEFNMLIRLKLTHRIKHKVVLFGFAHLQFLDRRE